jgi:hypothetical protein
LPAVLDVPSGLDELDLGGEAVGPAALAYTACPDCGIVLVMADGRQFSVPLSGSVSPLQELGGYSLSPDGRWLAMRNGLDLAVRDLTSGEMLLLPASSSGGSLVAEAWSPDSRWLLVRQVTGDRRVEHRLVELGDGGVRDVAPPAGWDFVGVLPSGELLSVEAGTAASGLAVTAVAVRVSDPSGDTVRELLIDADGWLHPGETLAGGVLTYPESDMVEVTPVRDGSLLVRVFGQVLLSGVLWVSPDGQVTARTDLGDGAEQWWDVYG